MKIPVNSHHKYNFRHRVQISLIALFSVLVISCIPQTNEIHKQQGNSVSNNANPYALILLIVIDQGAYDYLDRFAPLFKGGLKRLLEEGVVFKKMFHDHAMPVTAAGHATIVSGVNPSRSGMIDNNWYDREKKQLTYCVDDAVNARSPKNLKVSTIGDWIKELNGSSKVYSVSGKDRSAILLGGKRADGAYWYDPDKGQLLTSTYYDSSRSAWLDNYHSESFITGFLGKGWHTSFSTNSLNLEKFKIASLSKGAFMDSFPHSVGPATLGPNKGFFEAFAASPFLDELTLDAALKLTEAQDLGKDADLDLLSISLSAPDTVGHRYGPNSIELLDVMLRTDQLLGSFLERIERRLGRGNLLVALTADHGVTPLPEYLQKMKIAVKASREGFAEVNCIQNVRNEIRKKFGDSEWFPRDFYIDDSLLKNNRIEKSYFLKTAAQLLANCPSVEKVWTSEDLLSSAAIDLPFSQLYKNSFDPQRSPDIYLQRKKFHLEQSMEGTTHISPYEYDRHVPFILWANNLKHAFVTDKQTTTSIAPTIAHLAGIPFPENLDGSIINIDGY